jgi:hypothetical protein
MGVNGVITAPAVAESQSADYIVGRVWIATERGVQETFSGLSTPWPRSPQRFWDNAAILYRSGMGPGQTW